MTVTTQLTSKKLKAASVIFTFLMIITAMFLFFGDAKLDALVAFGMATIGRVVVGCLIWWNHG